MHKKQDNYVQVKFAVFCASMAFFAANGAFAADSILEGPPPNPCTRGADYVPGVDAAGQPVPRADIGAGPVAIPDQVYVPLANRGRRGRGGPGPGPEAGQPYAGIDGRRLEPLLNPPACQAPAPARRR
jgi:hypothetical protein